MLEFVDDSFTRENSFENILSIQLGLNGFSFSVRTESGHLLVVKQLETNISNDNLLPRHFEDWCNEEELLRLPYREKIIYYIGKRFSLVPEQLATETLNGEIRKLLISARTDEEYAENWIDEIKAKLLFMLPQHLDKALQERFGEYRIRHLVHKLIELPAANAHRNHMLLYFDEKSLFVLLRKNGKLSLCNVYQIHHQNDAVYYILAISRQLQVDAKDCGLVFAGESVFRDKTMALLSAHFGSTQKLDLPHQQHLNTDDVSTLICLL